MIRFSSRLVTRASAVVHARRCVASKAGKFKPGYVSTAPVEYTQKLKFFGEPTEVIPAYQVMDLKGKVIDAKQEPNLNEETLMKMYKTMVELHNTDQVLYDLQRQGAISFYMTSYGEYGTHVGSAAALQDADIVYGQYREAGVLMYRGFTIQDICNQCYSNELDLGKGRQMPVHYGSRKLNYHTISSPLSTQIPQAAGAAYAHRYLYGDNDRVVMCYFGEGAASEGDFHAALNMASTLECPTLFFCRNNGFAISTPVRDQFRGDGIAARGPGYGMKTVRVDGNDALAVYQAVSEARAMAVADGRPVLIEAMTYRIGHHSTSDDSTRYRKAEEIESWNSTNNPLDRFRSYLENKGLWDAERDAALHKTSRKAVLTAMKVAEKSKFPPIDEMFSDVYDKMPDHLLAQQQEMRDHLAKYPDTYPVDKFADPSTYQMNK